MEVEAPCFFCGHLSDLITGFTAVPAVDRSQDLLPGPTTNRKNTRIRRFEDQLTELRGYHRFLFPVNQPRDSFSCAGWFHWNRFTSEPDHPLPGEIHTGISQT